MFHKAEILLQRTNRCLFGFYPVKNRRTCGILAPGVVQLRQLLYVRSINYILPPPAKAVGRVEFSRSISCSKRYKYYSMAEYVVVLCGKSVVSREFVGRNTLISLRGGG